MTQADFLSSFGLALYDTIWPQMVRIHGNVVEHDVRVEERGGPLWHGLRLKTITVYVAPEQEYSLRLFSPSYCTFASIAAHCPLGRVHLESFGSNRLDCDLSLFESPGEPQPLDGGSAHPFLLRLRSLPFCSNPLITPVTLVLGMHGTTTFAGEPDFGPGIIVPVQPVNPFKES